ncbi:hypothetical protein BKA70DRAFT_1509581 [Coprinopsis sp. MPI-PUGE-AT-0042]|nr:hypothetical protein BKA70DRAFT_1509581 [Coprinopsis sp. MPI-PUGE-AT-0042]
MGLAYLDRSGIHLFMVLSSLSAFLRRSKEARKGHLHYILISCIILVTFSVDLALDMRRVFRVLFTGGPDPWSYRSAYLNNEQTDRNPTLAGDAMLAVTIAISDTVMLWRCYILWSQKRWVILLPCLTCVGAIGRNLSIAPSTVVKTIIASASLSVAMNIMVTSLILLRLSLTWWHTSKAFPNRRTPRMYLDVAGILIEAAAPLAVLGICFITTAAIDNLHQPEGLIPHGRLWALIEIFSWLYYSFCALSPQMIIYRVATGRSWTDTTESQAGGANVSQPIQISRAVGDVGGSESSSNDKV